MVYWVPKTSLVLLAEVRTSTSVPVWLDAMMGMKFNGRVGAECVKARESSLQTQANIDTSSQCLA